MDRIKIDLNKPTKTEEQLKISRLIENVSGKTLCIELENRIDINIGDTVIFRRYVNSESYDNNVIVKEKKLKVINIKIWDNKQCLLVEAPKYNTLIISSAYTINNQIRFDIDNKSNLFAQDLIKNSNGLTVYNVNDESSEYINSQILMSVFGEEEGITPKDFISGTTTQNTLCNGSISSITLEKYYIPVKWDRFSLYVSDNTIIDDPLYIIPEGNEFYHRTEETLTETLTSGWYGYVCNLYNYSGNTGISNTYISRNCYYWKTPVNITSNNDYIHLFQRDLVNDNLITDVKEAIVPNTIDMERIKYKPVIMGNIPSIDSMTLGGTKKVFSNKIDVSSANTVSSLTFNFHFRYRDGENWEVDDDKYWNEIQDSYTGINDTNINVSDVLGTLNFVDDDVRYQKLKVKKSFVRLSFYNSKDPLIQSLLAYSTIFLDGGELFGKFMGRRNELLQEGSWDEDDDPSHVISDTSTTTDYRVDSQLVIKNEYNMDKSSEGFNIYLFLEDALKYQQRTIYMKVEFNHAGVGKTIPMVMWPYKNGKPTGLSLSKYFDYVYIPITLLSDGKKFYYKISTDEENEKKKEGDKIETQSINVKGNSYVLNLFEPKLEKLSE